MKTGCRAFSARRRLDPSRSQDPALTEGQQGGAPAKRQGVIRTDFLRRGGEARPTVEVAQFRPKYSRIQVRTRQGSKPTCALSVVVRGYK